MPIKVTFDQLAATEQQIQSTFGQVNQQMDDLKRYLAPMVQTWQGAASENYNAAQHKWDAAAADLNNVLNAIGRALGQANEGYQSTEKSNAQRFA
ncbi:MAG: WXG100 family type VII secretion target [Jatrophihabitans sp.]